MKDAQLSQTIVFEGFRADEVYPADLDGDGRLEILALQSPGIYQSDVFDDTRWRLPEREKHIHCLTAFDTRGRVLWQAGQPYLDSLANGSHCADQMLRVAGDQVAVLQRNRLSVRDAATGRLVRETELDHDNYTIVVPWAGRWVIKNSEAPDAGYWYGDPAQVYDAGLQRVLTLPRTVGSGHSVRTFDLDGDGEDELLVGYEAYGADGRRRWRLDGVAATEYDPILHHEDQVQIGRLAGQPRVVYAGSTNFYAGTLEGHLCWSSALGHPQHVLLGNFQGGGRTASLAVLNIQVGPAVQQWAQQAGRALPTSAYANGIVWLTADGQIVNVTYPPASSFAHSGEGILLYPQGCADGSDAVLVRDCGWPRAYELSGNELWQLPQPTATHAGPDGYGVRLADFDGDGRAEILVHDRTTAWIFKPPYPAADQPHTHAKLRPVTGQGWYAV